VEALTKPCSLYLGPLNNVGYGQYEMCLGDKKCTNAHVHGLVFRHVVLHGGSVPQDHVIHHLCGVRSCGEESHLVMMGHSDHRRHHRNILSSEKLGILSREILAQLTVRRRERCTIYPYLIEQAHRLRVTVPDGSYELMTPAAKAAYDLRNF
jgi:hypothetical protein